MRHHPWPTHTVQPQCAWCSVTAWTLLLRSLCCFPTSLPCIFLAVMYPHPNSYTFHVGWFNHYYTKVRDLGCVCVVLGWRMIAWTRVPPLFKSLSSHFSLPNPWPFLQSEEEWDLKNSRGSPTRPRSAGRLFTEIPDGVDDVLNTYILTAVRARLADLAGTADEAEQVGGRSRVNGVVVGRGWCSGCVYLCAFVCVCVRVVCICVYVCVYVCTCVCENPPVGTRFTDSLPPPSPRSGYSVQRLPSFYSAALTHDPVLPGSPGAHGARACCVRAG